MRLAPPMSVVVILVFSIPTICVSQRPVAATRPPTDGPAFVARTVDVGFGSTQADSPSALLLEILGAVAGTGAGLGIHYLLNKGTDRNLGDGPVIPIFVLSQG